MAKVLDILIKVISELWKLFQDDNGHPSMARMLSFAIAYIACKVCLIQVEAELDATTQIVPTFLALITAAGTIKIGSKIQEKDFLNKNK